MSTDLSGDEYCDAIFPDRPFGPVPDEIEEEQWRPLHFLFGQVTLWAQAYEDGLAQFVVAAEERWKRSGMTAQKIWRLPLGLLPKEYPKYCHLQIHHRERMIETLKARNSLAHNFYRRRMSLLESVEGRKQIIGERDAAMDLFRQERDEIYWNLSLVTGETAL